MGQGAKVLTLHLSYLRPHVQHAHWFCLDYMLIWGNVGAGGDMAYSDKLWVNIRVILSNFWGLHLAVKAPYRRKPPITVNLVQVYKARFGN